MLTLSERIKAVQQNREMMKQVASTVDGLFSNMLADLKGIVRLNEEARRVAIIGDYRSGMSLRDVAAKHDVSHEYVRTVVTEAGVKRGRGRPPKHA